MAGAPGVDHEAMAAARSRLEDGEVLPASELADLLSLDGDGFAVGALGLVWESLSLAEVRAHLEVDHRHRQPYGIVHGGVWCAVVESLASVAGALHAAGAGRLVVGVSNATDFLRSHRDGRIDAVGTPIHVGRTQQLWQVVLTRAGDGAAVARGQVRLAVIEPERVAG